MSDAKRNAKAAAEDAARKAARAAQDATRLQARVPRALRHPCVARSPSSSAQAFPLSRQFFSPYKSLTDLSTPSPSRHEPQSAQEELSSARGVIAQLEATHAAALATRAEIAGERDRTALELAQSREAEGALLRVLRHFRMHCALSAPALLYTPQRSRATAVDKSLFFHDGTGCTHPPASTQPRQPYPPTRSPLSLPRSPLPGANPPYGDRASLNGSGG